MSKAKEKKPDIKSEVDAAYTQGREEREAGVEKSSMPHSLNEHQKEAWLKGWTEADNTIAEQKALAAESHDFADEAVSERYESLAELMTAFDNFGVSIDETQYRALSEEQQNIANKWANDQRIGTKRPVPEFLRRYATDAVKAFADGYHEQAEEQRKVLMRCRFGKPSPTKPEGDDGEPKIKMTVLVPLSELRSVTAESLFGATRCEVEFSLKPVSEWQKELPGAESTISCVAEIRGYSRKMRDWQFAFLVSQEMLEVNDAFDRFWKSQGSCRIKPIGYIKDDEKDEDDDTPEPEKKPEVPQKSLFSMGEVKPLYCEKLEGDEFVSPDEYTIPVEGDSASMIVYVGKGPNSQFYASTSMVFCDDDGEVQESDWLNPKFVGDGCVTAKAAIIKELGTKIDYAIAEKAESKFVDSLRNEMKRLESGQEPIPVIDE